MSSPNTAPLFEPKPLYDTQVIRNVDGYDIPVSYGSRGSYVDVKKRAEFLITALDAISERNRRDGLSVAAYTEPHSAPIWAEYRENTQSVLDGASNNRDRYQNQLRHSFWQATGFSALRGSGLMPERQINPRAQKMWRDFNKSYGHPEQLRARSKYRKVLKAQIKSLETPAQLSITDIEAA